jgi:hypothetical protein
LEEVQTGVDQKSPEQNAVVKTSKFNLDHPAYCTWMRPGVHILGFRAVSFTQNRELIQHLFGYPGSLVTISNVKMSKTNLDHPAYRIL